MMQRPRTRSFSKLPVTTQNSIRLCKRPDFQDYLGVDSEEAAKEELCRRCGVTSRKHLVWDSAAEKFCNEMDSFTLYKKEGNKRA